MQLEVALAWLYVVEDPMGAPLGYVMVRLDEGRRPAAAHWPWVARSPAGTAVLLAALLAPQAPWRASLAAHGELALTASLQCYHPDALLLWQSAGAGCRARQEATPPVRPASRVDICLAQLDDLLKLYYQSMLAMSLLDLPDPFRRLYGAIPTRLLVEGQRDHEAISRRTRIVGVA